MYRKRQLYQSQADWRKSKDKKAKRIATRGEELAAEYLESKSYTVLARNYRAGRSGEIDIIARSQDDILVFVEVKTRTINETVYGIPEFGFEAVGYKKQRRIAAVSCAFIGANFECTRWRYDVIVVAIHLREGIEISHVENAFY